MGSAEFNPSEGATDMSSLNSEQALPGMSPFLPFEHKLNV